MSKNVAIEQELESIRLDNRGILRPIDVVTFAEDPATALHAKFQWDDTVAAHQYRLWQAREIIQVRVTLLAEDVAATRAYVSLGEDRNAKGGGGGYRQIVDVLRNPKRRERFLTEALMEIERLQVKYGVLRELAAVWEAASAARKKKRKKRKR